MTKFAPCSLPQQLFLTSTADICFYGGQAGGGKTFSALLHHLKYIEDPLYRGLILRRTTPMLKKSGAIWDEAKTLYKEFDQRVKIRINDLKFIFPTGAEVALSHFERPENKDDFQGAQISSVFFDELCQFEEEQFLYILSRLRTKANMKPNARAAMNPDKDSFVRKWVDWYLYPQGHEFFGRPDPAKQGVIRWFIRIDDTMIWADTQEELLLRYPKSVALSFQFISASVYDNPHIDPSYIAFLEGLGAVEKERLLYGNWEARATASGFFKREWVKEITEFPDKKDIVKIVRAWDLAGELVSPANPSPDFSVGVKMAKLKNGNYVILDVVRLRARYGDLSNKIIKIAIEDGRDIEVLIPQDPNAAAKAACTQLVQQVIEGSGAKARRVSTNKSKIDRFRPFSASAENGVISIMKNCCNCLEEKIYGDNSFYYNELEKFTGGRAGHDDLVDATSDTFLRLSASHVIPNFLSGLKSANLTHAAPASFL